MHASIAVQLISKDNDDASRKKDMRHKYCMV